jgi:hypothetical protein
MSARAMIVADAANDGMAEMVCPSAAGKNRLCFCGKGREQPLTGFCDFLNCFRERRFVRARGDAVAADLANELQGSGCDFLRRCRYVGLSQNFYAAAHDDFPQTQSIAEQFKGPSQQIRPVASAAGPGGVGT